jgi:hypothetical protein
LYRVDILGALKLEMLALLQLGPEKDRDVHLETNPAIGRAAN